jgi:hypothetical protein
LFGLLPDEEGAVVLSVGQGELERDGVPAPVGDGVAMDASLFGRGRHGCAVRQGADDFELLSGKSVIRHKTLFLISR